MGRTLAAPVAMWTSVFLAITALQWRATDPPRTAERVWVRVDVEVYLRIATGGYRYSTADPYPTVAWFPGFPLLVRAASAVVTDVVWAGVLVSGLCGLLAAVMFGRWLDSQGVHGRARTLGLAVLLLYVYGWYLYGVPYGDAFFLAVALSAFVQAERGRLLWAVLLAGASSAIRPTGVAVAVGVSVIALTEWGVLSSPTSARGLVGRFRFPAEFRRDRIDRRIWMLPLTLWGVVAYSAFLWVRWGNPLLWLKVQESWQQGPSAGPASWFKVHLAARTIKMHELWFILRAYPQALVVLGVLCSVPFVGRRFGWGYGAYTFVLAAVVALGSNDFVGAGRYMLEAFPTAGLIGIWLARRRGWSAVWIAASAVLLCVHAWHFGRGAYLT